MPRRIQILQPVRFDGRSASAGRIVEASDQAAAELILMGAAQPVDGAVVIETAALVPAVETRPARKRRTRRPKPDADAT